MKKIFKTFVMLIALLVFWQNVSLADNPIEKLGRGLANTATGWIEVFTTVKRHSEEHGYAAGLLFGLPVGIGRALWRTSVGVYETVTFPVPLPRYYEPIMEPEFVFESPLFE